MILGKEVGNDVYKKERYLNDCLEIDIDEDEYAGRVYLEYTYKMNNANREARDYFRVVLSPENAPGKLVFFVDALLLSTHIESIGSMLKDLCSALEGIESNEEEYKKAWKKTDKKSLLDLVRVEFLKDMEIKKYDMKNNILALLESKNISIYQMSKDLNMSYSIAHKLVSRKSLNTTSLERLLEVAYYLNVDIYQLYS